MKLNINFLQTGGVPLTNDLMDAIQEQIKFYDFIGSMAGNLVIITGCFIVGSSITPGVVAINGECYYHEGGLTSSSVYIDTQEITKTFQDQTDKVLIERKTVKFGASTTQNTFDWAQFYKLDDLKTICKKANAAATQQEVNDLWKEIKILKMKTAPIQNGGIVWIWKKAVEDIPLGWKECTDLQGKTIFGRDPNNTDTAFKTAGNTVGSRTKNIMKTNLPAVGIQYEDVEPGNPDWNAGGFDGGNNHFTRRQKTTSKLGDGAPLDVLNPGRIVDFIEPDFQ